MRYETLGPKGPRISKICLGTMTFGEQNTETEGHQQLDHAVANGINFIDTAELYSTPARKETQGSTERIIGNWLSGRTDREDLIIATKIAGDLPFAAHIREELNYSKANMNSALEQSLDRLQTNYVDLYQLHWPCRNSNFFGKRGYTHDPQDKWEDDFLNILHTCKELIDSGRIRAWGVSNETPWGLMRILHLADMHDLPRPVSIQNPYSLVNRTFEIGLAEVCLRENIAVLPYSPTAFGLLSGKFHRGIDTPEARINRFGKNWSRYLGKNTYEATRRYLEIADEYGLNMVQMSLAYVNDRPFVTSNIIGARTMDQLVENIASIDLALSEEVLTKIEAVHEDIPNPAP